MQKRLGVARALLTEPDVLLVDEATHDLDPEGAMRIRDLVAAQAKGDRAVVWTTQRVEEIRGFADHVTLLTQRQGRLPRHRSRADRALEPAAVPAPPRAQRRQPARGAELNAAVDAAGEMFASEDGDEHHFLLALSPEATLGEAVNALTSWGVDVISCTEEQPKIEQAFISLTRAAAEAEE